jgi:benzodiazapine receptor
MVTADSVPSSSDRVRAVTVAAAAVAQVISSPVTTVLLGPSSNTGTISDLNTSPVTPAGYAFAIWGLIYLACLALAVYQLLPAQLSRTVHRRTGWWILAAFVASTVWVPVFGSRTIWLSQLVILLLVACLAVVTVRLTRLGPAAGPAERWLLRLPVTLYLGWATLATFAGFGTTLRSLGMPERAGWVTALSVALVVLAAAIGTALVSRETAVAGFAFTSCWALAAIAVATYETPVRVVALLALASVLVAVAVRTARSRSGGVVLLG